MTYHCARCGGPLNGGASYAMKCADCGYLYPIISGIPVLLADGIEWVAAYRESILALLVSHGDVVMDEIRLIESISEMVPGAEAQTFTQDWDLHEGPSAAKELLTDTAPSVLGTIELQEQTGGLYCVAEEMAQKCSGKLLEVGSGVGRFVQVLKKQTSHIHVLDNNLRALFENRRQYPDVSRVVGDAINMPFASETFDTVVALNVIDLLDEPEGFLEEAARILSAKGRLLLSTPDPALGVPDTDRTRLERCVRDAGFEILQIEDNRLWTRRPKPYELQVFCSQILLAELL